MTERRPATEAGLSDSMKLRVLAAWFDRFDDWREATGKIAPGISDYREVQNDLRRIADAIEAQAADARVAALVEALRSGLAAEKARYPKLKPQLTEEQIEALLSDLPVATAERPLDVERLKLALARAVIEADRLYPAGYSMTGDLVPLIAAEYARLSETPK